MASLVTVAELRIYLRLGDDTSEDGDLATLLDAAQGAVRVHLDRTLDEAGGLDDEQLAVVTRAILIFAGELYDMRGADAAMPVVVTWMLEKLRNLER